MITAIISLIAIASIVAFVILWFSVARRELLEKRDMMTSAEKQLDACEKGWLETRGDPSDEGEKAVISRSRDIYVQAVHIYNQTLRKPHYRVLGILLGFQKKEENTNEETNT